MPEREALLKQAEQARRLAAGVTDEQVKAELLKAAADYEGQAKLSEIFPAAGAPQVAAKPRV